MPRSISLDYEAQNALLALNCADDFDRFGKATSDLLKSVLPCIIKQVGFVLNPFSDGLQSTSFGEHDKETFFSGNLQNRLWLSPGLELDDPLVKLMPEALKPLSSGNYVYFWPVNGRTDKVVVLHMMLTSRKLSDEEESQLEFFEKQISTSYQNLLRHFPNAEQKYFKLLGGMYEKSFALLSERIIRYLQEVTQASSGLILAVDSASDELYHKVKRTSGVLVENRFELTGTFFENVVKSGSKINVNGTTSVSLCREKIISTLTDVPVKSLLCIPIIHTKSQKTFCVVCLFNEKTSGSFSQAKEEIVRSTCDYFNAQIFNALEWEKELVYRRQQEHLLNVAKNLFIHLDDVTVLLTEILQEARNLTQAEIGSLFLVDKERQELVSKVFFNHRGQEIGEKEETREVRVPLGQGISGHVAKTGVMLNIKDAYSHPLFCRDVDRETGFKTRNILCFPIRDEKEVIGVGQLVNKINGPAFTRFDEDLTKAFAIFCGISICHSLLYKKVMDAQNRDKITNELMIYHMKVTSKDVQYYSSERILKPQEVDKDFHHILFRPRLTPNLEFVKACMSMFEDMDLIRKWKISYETLIRFILMIKKGYRDLPYHNWTHAFTVSHFCYLLYKNLQQIDSFSDMEILSLFVSCLCHDLDHRGTNNAFQVSYNSVLAALYSSEGSVMERHHFAQTCCILNTEGCNIFENLTGKEYHEIMDLTRKIILATDLSHHFKILKDLKKLARLGFSPSDQTQRELLLYLMMTSCDLSDQVKPFDSASAAADLVYAEFFSQGDLEKAMGNKPSEMMDRERACIPKLQIDFIDSVVYPTYRLLAEIFPETEVLCTVIDENKEQWKEIEASGEYRKFEVPSTYSAPLSPLPQLEKCKIERKLNALQHSTCRDDESKKYFNISWQQTNGERE
ncbi:cGMP-dependent 3',5'-cyclic phosphodiesterase-like isoform X2 [Dendronephthya gigantea]|uniref:cGMP-dependent 3',5'-cyclic phosphodiesterase-like isoform X2 n=1 Tax=Dendronephthya gigantea TaxID=151771 RepID=UPI00106C98AD|nr:cGMP-dependent 3',5'-cyclic phosphodiesterase-like isoform X2 [Dendronephthya gigantea]